ncbi:hypothetical protein CDAIGKPJ_00835 [Aeromonas salmonicida]
MAGAVEVGQYIWGIDAFLIRFIKPMNSNRLHFKALNCWVELQQCEEITFESGLEHSPPGGLVMRGHPCDIAVVLRDLAHRHLCQSNTK